MKILLVKKTHQDTTCYNLYSTINMPGGRPQKYANEEERKAGNRARVQKHRQKKNNAVNMQTQLDGLGRPDTAERTSERLGVRAEDIDIPAG